MRKVWGMQLNLLLVSLVLQYLNTVKMMRNLKQAGKVGSLMERIYYYVDLK